MRCFHLCVHQIRRLRAIIRHDPKVCQIQLASDIPPDKSPPNFELPCDIRRHGLKDQELRLVTWSIWISLGARARSPFPFSSIPTCNTASVPHITRFNSYNTTISRFTHPIPFHSSTRTCMLLQNPHFFSSEIFSRTCCDGEQTESTLR